MLAGVESVLSRRGYDLHLRSAIRDTPTSVVDSIMAVRGRVDALLMVDVHLEEEELDEISRFGHPILTLGSRTKGIDSLTIDNREAARAVGHHLVNLGHREIALVEGDPGLALEHASGYERSAGFREALAEHGLEISTIVNGGFSVRGGVEAFTELWAAPERPTAVFCLSDEMALGLLATARRHGIDVPRELSVVGFDDHDLAEAEGLTTVRQDIAELGVLATRRLLSRVTDGGGPTHEVVETGLVVRASTGRPSLIQSPTAGAGSGV